MVAGDALTTSSRSFGVLGTELFGNIEAAVILLCGIEVGILVHVVGVCANLSIGISVAFRRMPRDPEPEAMTIEKSFPVVTCMLHPREVKSEPSLMGFLRIGERKG